MERKGHSRIEIKSASDFNCIVDDMLGDFLEGFTEAEGLIRKPDEEDFYSFGHDDIKFMYTQSGMKLYERACKRYFELGKKYFDESDLDIKSCNMMMP